MLNHEFIDHISRQCHAAVLAIESQRANYIRLAEFDTSDMPDSMQGTLRELRESARRSVIELESFCKLVSAIPQWVSADFAPRVVN